jgi:hypothetical protein
MIEPLVIIGNGIAAKALLSHSVNIGDVGALAQREWCVRQFDLLLAEIKNPLTQVGKMLA